jgi:hypothetical protein
MMTEQETIKRRCPQKLANSDLTGVGSDTCCDASECMAWRWVDQTSVRGVELWSKSKKIRVHSAWADDAEWRPVGPDAQNEPPQSHGYCGLAGKT